MCYIVLKTNCYEMLHKWFFIVALAIPNKPLSGAHFKVSPIYVSWSDAFINYRGMVMQLIYS